MQNEIVYAIHSFEAEADDEIAFNAGDSIVVLEKDEKYMDGWWQGRNPQGQVGLFPMNYTTHVKPGPTNTPALSPAHSSSGSNTLEDEIDNAITHVSTNLITPSTSTATTATTTTHPTTTSATDSTSTKPTVVNSPSAAPPPPSVAAFMHHQPQPPPPAGSPPPPPSTLSSSSLQPPVLAPSSSLPPPSSSSTTSSTHDSMAPSSTVTTPTASVSILTPPMTTTSSPLPTLSSSTTTNNTNSKIDEWTIDQVADWLQSVGLDHVSNNFIEQEITGDILLSLTLDSLKELGITAYGRRYKVMTAIEKLKSTNKVEGDHVSSQQQQLQPPPQQLPPPQRQSQSETSNSSVPCSPIDSDSIYQFPRKAPMPPQSGNNSTELNHHSSMASSNNSLRRPTDSLLTTGQLSPRSYASSSVSRSNTFQTISSSKSSSSSSGRMPSQKSRDSVEKERLPSIDDHHHHHLPHHHHQQPMASIHELSTSPPPVHPMEGRTLSMAAAAGNGVNGDPFATRDRNMSVASVDPFALSNRASTNVFKAPEHEGWLHKQGDKYKTWNKRWFVLKGSNLFYFKSPKEVRMKGIIHLRGYRIVPDESIHPGKYSFKAQHERERTFYFYTDSKESMRTWIKVLMKATITRDFASPVMSSNHVATVPLEVAQRLRPRPPSVLIHPNGKTATTRSPPLSPVERQQDDWQLPVQPSISTMDRLSPQPSQQSRESGITVYPAPPTNNKTDTLVDRPFMGGVRDEEDEQDVPDRFMYHQGPSPIAPAPTLSSSILMSDEDEDLIDPQHKGMHSPLQSPPLPPANLPPPPPSTSSASRNLNRVQYIDWINKYLPPGKRAIDLSGAFRNGDSLILLLESLSGKSVRRPPNQKGGSVSMMMLDNIVAAFKFMGREGVVVDGRYTIKDIFGGDEEKIMDMLDAIMEWHEKQSIDA
ncbi:hypothetical protein BDA99DRAFT_40656 [Phascolomyces articulosus]|uniref:Polar growth protein n=1 Tax=Phascolomyces articulosus TaxID=60185 RepID=A0AAD5PGI2_9FUNG|nr:hypothetical protein BDA99DRAFT_40656 [Phascolomyces articulosus]